jgi:hypothetical protein
MRQGEEEVSAVAMAVVGDLVQSSVVDVSVALAGHLDVARNSVG